MTTLTFAVLAIVACCVSASYPVAYRQADRSRSYGYDRSGHYSDQAHGYVRDGYAYDGHNDYGYAPRRNYYADKYFDYSRKGSYNGHVYGQEQSHDVYSYGHPARYGYNDYNNQHGYGKNYVHGYDSSYNKDNSYSTKQHLYLAAAARGHYGQYPGHSDVTYGNVHQYVPAPAHSYRHKRGAAYAPGYYSQAQYRRYGYAEDAHKRYDASYGYQSTYQVPSYGHQSTYQVPSYGYNYYRPSYHNGYNGYRPYNRYYNLYH
ncbi:putative eggshell protein [Aplysia californica]|uniref:Eggshell protein n=1 Tax=Aplysia californica TaxID=6500 RepID=A0ABM1ABN9_APLCA|nr:putative eggshell protein [Aplysia californica]